MNRGLPSHACNSSRAVMLAFPDHDGIRDPVEVRLVLRPLPVVLDRDRRVRALRPGLVDVANANEISPYLLEAVVWQESRWNPSARSRVGAIGLAQLMPGTARDLGVDPRDPIQNLSGGARYLRQQLNRFDGNVEKALAAYNAGPGRVMTAGGIPSIPETQAYVRAIVARLAANSIREGNLK